MRLPIPGETPDEGYEIDQVTSNGLWEEKGYLYVLKDTDAALKVMFKKIEEPEPTVTPTATPTPTVTRSEEHTSELQSR